MFLPREDRSIAGSERGSDGPLAQKIARCYDVAMRLADLYQELDGAARSELAVKAGTTAAYLWQLANRWQGRSPSVDMLQRLAAAEPRLTVEDMVVEFSKRRNAA